MYSASLDKSVSVALVVLGSSLSRRVSVLMAAYTVPTCFATFSASAPVIKYSAFMYPLTEPDWIWYQTPPSPSTVFKMVAAQLL